MNEKAIVEPQRLVMPTVKVRRLGYLCGLTEILGKDAMPQSILVSRLVEWAQRNQRYLQDYSQKLPVVRRQEVKVVGCIQSEEAARRYIGVSKEIGLLVQIARQLQNSKIGNVLRALPKQENPFDLSLTQIFLILKMILRTDYDYLATFFDMRNFSPRQYEESEWRIFQRKVKERLSVKMASTRNLKKMARIQDAKKDLESWERNPERFYKENIRATRLEWLLDLKLLVNWNQKEGMYRFRNNAGLFFEQMILEDHWLNNIFPFRFGECFKSLFTKAPMKWVGLSQRLKNQLLEASLDESSRLFSPSTALLKISATQFLEYFTAELLAKHSVLADFRSLEKDAARYMNSGKSQYRFVKMMSGDDVGYIVRN